MQSYTEIGLLAAGAVVLIAAGVWIVTRVRRDPAKREWKRRNTIARMGRLSDGFVTDFQENFIFYSYSLGGVEYTASQDIAQIRDRLPGDSQMIIGPVTIKYLPRNPANSIVVCEEWSGFRQGRTIFPKGE